MALCSCVVRPTSDEPLNSDVSELFPSSFGTAYIARHGSQYIAGFMLNLQSYSSHRVGGGQLPLALSLRFIVLVVLGMPRIPSSRLSRDFTFTSNFPICVRKIYHPGELMLLFALRYAKAHIAVFEQLDCLDIGVISPHERGLSFYHKRGYNDIREYPNIRVLRLSGTPTGRAHFFSKFTFPRLEVLSFNNVIKGYPSMLR
ncbi:hypothetical protein BDZ89DRAFT_757431 [Hymenopellis radicata]|nr:hypothetical protein BDZ89DRAFT_757431 [Hymenopellis radicata]